mgnify:CR=1 FL=1
MFIRSGERYTGKKEALIGFVPMIEAYFLGLERDSCF